MAMTKLAMVLLAMTAAMAMVAEAGKVYEVKWDFPSTDKYSAVQGKVYSVGDTLTFMYMQEMHNVVKVQNVNDFLACKTSTPVIEYADGHTSMKLDRPGPHYFICSFPGHCEDGMKIKVVVR